MTSAGSALIARVTAAARGGGWVISGSTASAATTWR